MGNIPTCLVSKISTFSYGVWIVGHIRVMGFALWVKLVLKMPIFCKFTIIISWYMSIRVRVCIHVYVNIFLYICAIMWQCPCFIMWEQCWTQWLYVNHATSKWTEDYRTYSQRKFLFVYLVFRLGVLHFTNYPQDFCAQIPH